MAELLVLGFRAESTAQVALSTVDLMRNEGLIHLEDLALLTRRDDGHIDVKHTGHRNGGGATGAVVGALAAVPAYGNPGGTPANMPLDQAGQLRIDAEAIARLADGLAPGSGQVVMLVDEADDGKVAERLAPYDPQMVVTTLPEPRAAAYRAMPTDRSSGR